MKSMDRSLTIVGLLAIGVLTAWQFAAGAEDSSPPGAVPPPVQAPGESVVEPPAGGAMAPLTPPAAAAAAPSSSEPATAAPRTFWEILRASGVVGLVIILLSIAAGALVIEQVITLRASVLMPPGLEQEVHQLLGAGKLAAADQRCQMQPSFLSFVLLAGITEADGGWHAVEKAMEDATAEQSSRLFRRIEYLSVIGNIATMLGLLGTVIGMVMAFRELANSQGAARPADLAEGIYLALVTTVEGLVVAIPSLGAFAVLRNRIDHLVAEVVYSAQHVTGPLKRLRLRQPAPAAPPQRAMPGPPPIEGGR